MTFGPPNTQSSYLTVDFELTNNKELLNELISKRERQTASILNIKENGQYELVELLSAQQWFSTNAAGQPNKPRYGFRTTVDLVALNGGNIGAGTTNLTLTATTIPPAINGWVNTLPGGGGATATDNQRFFLNHPQVYVSFNTTTQIISITNNYGANLTQCYVDFEYLKS